MGVIGPGFLNQVPTLDDLSKSTIHKDQRLKKENSHSHGLHPSYTEVRPLAKLLGIIGTKNLKLFLSIHRLLYTSTITYYIYMYIRLAKK